MQKFVFIAVRLLRTGGYWSIIYISLYKANTSSEREIKYEHLQA